MSCLCAAAAELDILLEIFYLALKFDPEISNFSIRKGWFGDHCRVVEYWKTAGQCSTATAIAVPTVSAVTGAAVVPRHGTD